MTDKELIDALWAVISDLEDALGPAGGGILEEALEENGVEQ